LLVPAELAVDANRDGTITLASDLNPDPELSDQTSEKKPFFFPINDDDDNPGTTPQADYINTVVDGADDLPDFFPVFLDIKQLITVLPPSASVKYKLKQEDSGLNFVYTSLTRATAFAYQNATAATTGYGPSANQAAANATTQQITAAGVELPAAFLTRIKDQDQGVILVELRWMTAKPLKLVVEKDGTQIAEVAANIATGEIKWESQYADNPVESFKVPSYYSDYTTKPLGWLEGLRYFTDGADKNATFHRTRINVKVKMAGAAGKSVKLKAFDVDDPTPAEWDASPAVIDTNDTNGPVGNDNNTGLDATTGSYNQIFGTFYGPTNQVYSDSIIVTLDSGGEASVGFNLSSKPGANYRVAAQLSDSASGIDVLQVTNSTAGKYVSSDNKPVRGFSGVTSPTLTIWRKLHIEIDSMAAIPTEVSSSQKNYATGVIVAEHSTGGPFVSLDLSESLSDRSRYTEQGSRIEIEGVGTYPNGSFSIFEATAANTVRFYVPGGVPSVVGRKYKIYDDDFEVIPLPLTSIAGPVIDRLKAYYAPTFIEPRPAQNPATSVGFVLNQGVPPLLATSVTWNDAQNTADTSYFWQHLVTFGHQGPASEDMDGDIEQYLGATLKNGIFGRYSAIFTETIRDSEYMNRPRDTNAGTQKRFIDWVAMIVAHEIGHAPGTNSSGSDHAETGIMQTGGTSNVQESFSAKSILRFRSTTTWSQP
ncbi:MAG: hypothetical protein NTU80_04295, partial [Verrucomicrobia bacterium]|nr:hypothetical protein [Verrucomicrobiota bacterium]